MPALFRRKRGGDAVPATVRPKVRGMDRAVVEHLQAFATSRRGVEAYVEPATTVTQLTIVLVALDGEWTRRRIGSAKDAAELGRRLGIPVYDVQATGYPPRMREWTQAQKAQHEKQSNPE